MDAGTGVVNLAPVEDDSTALRWQLWGATDQAYKAATAALATKKGSAPAIPPPDQPVRRFCFMPRRLNPWVRWSSSNSTPSPGKRPSRRPQRSPPHRSEDRGDGGGSAISRYK